MEIKIAFYDSTFLSSILQFSSGFVKEIEENASAKETRELILHAIYEAAVGWWTWGSWCSSSHHLGPEGARDFRVTGSTGEGVPRDHKSTNPT